MLINLCVLVVSAWQKCEAVGNQNKLVETVIHMEYMKHMEYAESSTNKSHVH